MWNNFSLGLAYFAKYNDLKLHPFCCTYQDLILYMAEYVCYHWLIAIPDAIYRARIQISLTGFVSQ